MYVNEDDKDNKDKQKGRRTQAERRAATRRALAGAARELFAGRGYLGVSVEEIVRRAGMTRGALYHHFEDKRDLFRAVVEEIEVEIDELVLEAAWGAYGSSGDPLEGWRAATYAYLDACLKPDAKRVMLLDGPAVLGWEEWNRIDAEHGMAAIEEGLKIMADHGLMERPLVGPMAHLIRGAFLEAAMYVAVSDDPETARDEIGYSLKRLMDGLAAVGGKFETEETKE